MTLLELIKRIIHKNSKTNLITDEKNSGIKDDATFIPPPNPKIINYLQNDLLHENDVYYPDVTKFEVPKDMPIMDFTQLRAALMEVSPRD